VVRDDLRSITDVFRAHGASPPHIVWNPRPSDITAPPLRFLLERWIALKADAGGVPHDRQIDLASLEPAAGYLMLIEPIDDGRDFRYLTYGDILARISNIDMTGRRLSEHPASAYAIDFGLAVYHAVCERREPIYSERHPAGARDATVWLRLVLPFVDDAGTVVRLISGSVAIGRDGELLR